MRNSVQPTKTLLQTQRRDPAWVSPGAPHFSGPSEVTVMWPRHWLQQPGRRSLCPGPSLLRPTCRVLSAFLALSVAPLLGPPTLRARGCHLGHPRSHTLLSAAARASSFTCKPATLKPPGLLLPSLQPEGSSRVGSASAWRPDPAEAGWPLLTWCSWCSALWAALLLEAPSVLSSEMSLLPLLMPSSLAGSSPEACSENLLSPLQSSLEQAQPLPRPKPTDRYS